MGQELLQGIPPESKTGALTPNCPDSITERSQHVSERTASRDPVTFEDRKESLKKRFKGKVRDKNKYEGAIEQAELVIEMIRHWSISVEGAERKVDLDVYLEDQLLRQIIEFTRHVKALDEEISVVLQELKTV